MSKTEQPILAQSLSLYEYVPQYGDYIIWSGWFTTTYGFIVGYFPTNRSVNVITAGNPSLLLQLTDGEKARRTSTIELDKILKSSSGTFTILRSDKKTNANIWFI